MLHAFSGAEGAFPQGQLFYALINKAVVVAGTAQGGGAQGDGSVFDYNLFNGRFADIHDFAGSPTDGFNPLGGVALNASLSHLGSIAGVTSEGGANNDGALWTISPQGVESLVYSFGSVPNPNNPNSPLDGTSPEGTLAQAFDGNFYSTTSTGGQNNLGTVFRYSPSSGTVTSVYSFGASTTDAALPQEGLVLGFNHLLYGTSTNGGANSQGAVYSITTSGPEKVLYSFGSLAGAADGANPQCLLAVDPHGNIWGTAPNGGLGAGTVWEISNNAFRVVYTFPPSGANGSAPIAGLSFGPHDLLYGTASAGGANGDGVIYSINPATGAFSKVHDFNATTDGSDPLGTLLLQPLSQSFYGTTGSDGPNGFGTLFRFKP
ncbi:MAG: choice-of-anchor tandem repeat GloVer-containing protein [Vulcanimicrobiaceae bacterium]